MSRRIVLALEAEREFDAAADWYESQAGLGAEFVTIIHGHRDPSIWKART